MRIEGPASPQDLSADSDMRPEDVGFTAESVLKLFLERRPGITFRFSTKEEDSGARQIVQGKQIDGVAYVEGKPAMVVQCTTARDPRVRQEKMQQLKDRQFFRLDEMSPRDPAIPKVLVWMNPDEVVSFTKDGDPSSHPSLEESIDSGVVNSLKFALLKTKDADERKRIETLIERFE